MRKRKNKWVERGKGIKCVNCDRYDWRYLPMASTSKTIFFYCIHCSLIRVKVGDEDLKDLRRRALKHK